MFQSERPRDILGYVSMLPLKNELYILLAFVQFHN